MRSTRFFVFASIAIIGALTILALSGSFGGQGEEIALTQVPLLCVAEAGIVMGQGCCSWHGGECGCKGGRDVCCDGTLSPSCTCHN